MSMDKTSKTYILTANDLKSGDVVFFTASRRWSKSIADAALSYGPAALATLEALATSAEIENATASAYVIEIEDEAGMLVPVRKRERIRLQGPSFRPDLWNSASSQTPENIMVQKPHGANPASNSAKGADHVSL